jgi:ASC-1-like (ASCH) protein
MRHQLRLVTTPFSAIRNGKKTIEGRLFDEKRQTIQPGDEVEFTNREHPDEKIIVKVVGLLRYQNFHDLFSRSDFRKFGGESVEWLEDQISEFYSTEQQAKNGVIGIEFELVDKT